MCVSSFPGDLSLSYNHWSVLYLAAANCDSSHCGNKFLIVWILYPVVLLLIFLLEEGLTCLFSLRQTADCQIPDKDIFFFSPHLVWFSKSVHLLPCTSHCLFSFFTLSHLSWFFSFQNPDTNECLSPHACQLNERCMNTAGSYVCQRPITCPPGYQINNDICEGTLHLIMYLLTSTVNIL